MTKPVETHSKAFTKARLHSLSLIAAAMLAACGGGTGTSDVTETTTSASPDTTVPTEDAEARKLGKISLSPSSSTQTSTTTTSSGTTTSWTQCATEGGTCSFSGGRSVKYGTTTQNVTRTLTGGTACNNTVFGDPAVGILKTCWVSGSTTSETTATATPPATTTPMTSGTSTTSGTTTATAPSSTTTTTSTSGSSTATTSTSTSSGGTSSTAAAGPRVSSFTASGPITASAGQVISGVRISNANGPCITIPSGATGVVVRDSDIGPCGGSANIVVYGSGAVIEHVFVHNGNRGVLAQSTGGVVTRLSKFDTFYGPKYNGTAIEYDYMSSGEIDRNLVTGSSYASDAVSVYESSNMRLTNNTIDINVSEPSAAAFTMGDSTSGNPGSNNYVAYNTVKQSGGVPAGVFGSNSNTLLEKNCLSAGIQAYNYSGIFNGVTVRNNVINLSASFVPVTSALAGWSSNVDGTDCSRVPA
jgi:hypothetical protein